MSPLLPLHISAGIVGILSGAAAMSFRKGSARHALAGKVFVIAMLTLAASAVYLALMKHQLGNVLGGTFTFYLVATAWMTARRGDGKTGIFDWVALLIPLLVGTALLILGLEVVLWPREVASWSSRWDVLFHGFRDAACRRGGHPHAGARRRFRRQAHRAPSLAHVLRVFHRHRVLLPGTATSLPRLVTRIKRTFYPGPLAAGIADFLAVPSSLHKCIPGKVDAARRRCFLLAPPYT